MRRRAHPPRHRRPVLEQPTPGQQQEPPQPPPDEEEKVTEEAIVLGFWPIWVLPFACVGVGFLLWEFFPEDLQDFYVDKVIPFGVTFWLGMFITYGWELQRLWIQDLPRKWAPWVVGGAIVFVLFAMGGPQMLLDDPWLVGMVVFPGLRIGMSYQRTHHGPHRQA
jgi:hypothetical protein